MKSLFSVEIAFIFVVLLVTVASNCFVVAIHCSNGYIYAFTGNVDFGAKYHQLLKLGAPMVGLCAKGDNDVTSTARMNANGR